MRNDRYRPDVPPYLLYGFLGLSLVLNLYMVSSWDQEPSPAPVAANDALMDLATAPMPAEGAYQAVAPAAEAGVAMIARPQDLGVPAPAPAAVSAGWNVVRGAVDHSLARTFRDSVGGDQADAVAAVYSRVFMWDMDLRRDLRKGDEVTAAWRLDDQGEYDMPVAWFRSSKLGQTMRAYRYQAPGDAEASYWYADGTEVSLRLVGGPIESYVQITSLLKDRPTHKGMDFKADVGSEVVSPKAGTVTRVNWNWSANGNCVEVRFADGTLAKFLHLDKVKVEVGQHVASGQVVALSGNTGRSTAPHLHYQLDRGDKVIDPLKYHDTVRRSLPPQAMPDFQQHMARLDGLLGETVAAR